MIEEVIINNLKSIIKSPAALNLNDDVFFDKKKLLVASIDTYNEDVHYINFKFPNRIIKKVIRSSISDIISKGVDPKFLLISFSGSNKNFNKKNIKLISNSIREEQKKYNFSLVGGDTTFSKKSSFTICVFGYSKKIIKRDNYLINDDIYITGYIGDSSVGLDILKNKIKLPFKHKAYFVDRYFEPKLAFGFHRELSKFANSSMDISDGLLIDLKKLIGRKKKGFIINLDTLPISPKLKLLLKKKKLNLNNYIFNGDDYQILFTSKIKNRDKIIQFSKKWNQKITMIGTIAGTRGNYLKFNDKLNKIVDYHGYIHDFR